MLERRIRMATALLAGATIAFAAIPAALAERGEETDTEKVVRRVIAINGEEECEDGDENCLGFVWMVQDDSSDPGRPQVQVFPFGAGVGRGYLGVEYKEIGKELLEFFGVRAEHGALVAAVVEESPAARAGVRVGDVITAVDAKPLAGTHQLAVAIGQHEDGDVVRLELWRDRDVETVDVTLEERQRPQFDFGRMVLPGFEPERFLFRVDPEAMAEAREKFELMMEDGELQSRLKGMSFDEQRLRERLEQVEGQLQKLHERLEEALAEAEKER